MVNKNGLVEYVLVSFAASGHGKQILERNSLGPETCEPRSKNPALLSIESWLVNRDPYFMAYEIVPI